MNSPDTATHVPPIDDLIASMRERWAPGTAGQVEYFLARYPRLAEDRQVLLDLIYNEILILEEHGGAPNLRDYEQRFPELSSELQAQFEVDDLFNDSSSMLEVATQDQLVAASNSTIPSIPGYELLEVLGRGGMGVVYKARQSQLNRMVALKTLKSGNAASSHERLRFQAEAEAIARFQHPNLVQIFEVGVSDGQFYLALELIEGGTLGQLLDGTPWPAANAAELVAVLASAIDYAHQQGIIHRDLKPANVLLQRPKRRLSESRRGTSTTVNPAGSTVVQLPNKTDTIGYVPKIADFGLAKDLDDSQGQTESGVFMGTPSYAAPEQASGQVRRISARTDVYALGVILYEALTGSPPFRGASLPETLDLVRNQEPVPPRQVNPKIPVDLETICLQCLRKSPDDRYATAQSLADDLRRFLNRQPIRARPVGAFERASKWVRRHPTRAALFGVSTLALAAVIATFVSMSYQSSLESLNQQLVTAADNEKAARGLADEQRDQAFAARRELARHRYASDVSLAGRAWREGDISRMVDLLERQKPHDGEADLRGFEWYYLRGLEQSEVWRTTQRAVLSPSGRYFAVWMADGVRALDARTRQTVSTMKLPEDFSFVGMAFSGNSERLIAPTTGTDVMVWEVATGNAIATLSSPTMNVASVALSGTGAFAATIGQGNDHTIRLWDVATGKQIDEWRSGGYPGHSTFDLKDQRFAFIMQGRLHVYDLSARKMLVTIPNVQAGMGQTTFDPSGKVLLYATPETIYSYDATTGNPIFPIYRSRGLRGNCISFTPDGKYIATGVVQEQALCLWDGMTGELLTTRRGHEKQLIGVTLHPNGTEALTHSLDGTSRYWDLRGPQEQKNITGPFRTAWNLSYVPGRSMNTLAYLNERGQLYEYYGTDHRLVANGLATTGPACSYAYRPDGQFVAGLRANRTITVWNAHTGAEVYSLTPKFAFQEVLFNRAGTQLATTCSDFNLRLWDANTGQQLYQTPVPRGNNGVVQLYYQPMTDKLLMAQAFDGYQLVDLQASPVVQHVPSQEKTYKLQFSPDGRFIVKDGPGVFDQSIWSFPAFERVQTLQGHTAFVGTSRFSPDGQRVASISADKTLRIWDVSTGQELLRLATPASSHFAVSTDGEQYAVAANDGLIVIWDAKAYRAKNDMTLAK